MPPDPDLDLVRALQAGDSSALSQLIARHQDSLFRFIYRHLLNEQDTKEVLQDTFVRMYFKIHTYHPRAKFITWLYRIALNLCRDQVRSRHQKQKKQTDSLEGEWDGKTSLADSLPDAMTTAFENVSDREQMAILRKAISELPEELKTAFILAALEGKTHLECAEILGTTAKTIEMRVYRARKLLLEVMSSNDGIR